MATATATTKMAKGLSNCNPRSPKDVTKSIEYLISRLGGLHRRVSAEEGERRRHVCLEKRIYAEYEAHCEGQGGGDVLPMDERIDSHDCSDLKALLKDFQKSNRERGRVVDYKTLDQPQSAVPKGSSKHDYVPELNKDDVSVIELGQRAVHEYNQKHNLKLEILSVLKVRMARNPIEWKLLIQACDPTVARVPVRLDALCTLPRLRVHNVSLSKPVPFLNVLQKDIIEGENMSSGEREALLYANIQNCPILDKRLGLKGRHVLHFKLLSRLLGPQRLHGVYTKGYSAMRLKGREGQHLKDSFKSVFKLSLDDNTLLSLSRFAVDQHNANQGSGLQFLRPVGAWRESLPGDISIYHIVLEALDNRRQKKFYAAVFPNHNGNDAEVLEWVATNSRRTTMNEV